MISLLLEFNSPSCKAMGDILSMDMSPCESGKVSHLFGCGDCLGSGLGGAVADGYSSAWGVLANGIDRSDEGNHPNKT